jgi:peptidoglycan biosynthesis protein MviN/MurJ (putative lipid II flippase)
MSANYLGGARRRVRLSIATILANIVLAIVLVPLFGAIGAAVAATAAFVWYVGSHYDLTVKLLGHEGGRSQLRQLARPIGRAVVAALVGGAVAFGVRVALDGSMHDAAVLAVATLAGVVTWAACAYPLLRDQPSDDSSVVNADTDLRGAA